LGARPIDLEIQKCNFYTRIIHVNKTISQGSSLDVTGEIIFDAKGLAKEQIVGLEQFIKEVKIIEERTINKSF